MIGSYVQTKSLITIVHVLSRKHDSAYFVQGICLHKGTKAMSDFLPVSCKYIIFQKAKQ